MKPDEIESSSFQIIDGEAGRHDFSARRWQIVRRMIHTSADFEYMKTIRFHPKAITAGINAISQGCSIITDTNMARAGIRQNQLKRFNVSVNCFISDSDIIETAEKTGETRAKVAVDYSISKIKKGIYVIGNAPTALIRLVQLVKSKKVKPALIIGLPVGFVNAEESKSALMEMDYPYISNTGRKGGSNVAASVVNALINMV